jgi:type IV secretory pathway VirD2 relaxase
MKPINDGIRIRPGRVRSRGDASSKRFVSQVLRAAEKAGGAARRVASSSRSSTFGRGRSASLRASRGLHARTRLVTVKARVVRHSTRAAPLATHVAYLQRDGVTKDGAPGRLFDAEQDEADGRAFAERSADDRHHFRFIISPENAAQMSNLQALTRDLMTTAEQDLGTQLEWVAVEHHNTEHPHVHVLVRGRTDDGSDLVISRDYIREGMRARAQALVTIELGPRTDLEIRRGLEVQVDAERWTPLDRGLARTAADNEGIIDLRPDAAVRSNATHHARLGRMQKLERLGLASPAGPAQWTLSPDAESSLRGLGDRGDIIRRLHQTMGARSPSEWIIDGEGAEQPVIGKLVTRGLDDELKGTAYAVVDSVDGRVHHLRLPDLDATSDAAPGAVVEMRRFTDAGGRERVALAVRSDLGVEAQVSAQGATWLDRRLIAREATALSEAGFGGEVLAALDRRTEHLVGEGLARRQGQRILFARDLLDTLRNRELTAAGERLAARTGLPARTAKEGEHLAGVYRQRVTLASGRFAMIDDGLGFSLVPWTPKLDRHLGRQVTGVATASGVDWSFGKKRGLGVG